MRGSGGAVRWLLTPEEYYEYEVKHILNTTLPLLDEDTTDTLRYHWVETAWLPMWLADGDADAKLALLKRVVQSGKVEILGGASVMRLAGG